MLFKQWHIILSGSLLPSSLYVREERMRIRADITEHLLCAKHCGKCVVYGISFPSSKITWEGRHISHHHFAEEDIKIAQG